MTHEPDFRDSVHALYDLTCAEENIDAESIDAFLDNAVEQQVRELYNNREEVAEQLSNAGEAIEDAKKNEQMSSREFSFYSCEIKKVIE